MNGESNPNYRHGGSGKNRHEYNSWRAMRTRCNSTSYRRYDLYGGRGIKVCDRWNDPKMGFINFIEDMGKKPTPKHTIDRIDNDGDYSPDNCRWATHTEQIRNTKIVVVITVNGVTDTLRNHIKRSGISTGLYYNRIRSGMTRVEALTAPKTARAIYDARRKASQQAKIKDCKICGSRCKNIVAIYCSKDCFHKNRNGKGRFVSA